MCYISIVVLPSALIRQKTLVSSVGARSGNTNLITMGEHRLPWMKRLQSPLGRKRSSQRSRYSSLTDPLFLSSSALPVQSSHNNASQQPESLASASLIDLESVAETASNHDACVDSCGLPVCATLVRSPWGKLFRSAQRASSTPRRSSTKSCRNCKKVSSPLRTCAKRSLSFAGNTSFSVCSELGKLAPCTRDGQCDGANASDTLRLLYFSADSTIISNPSVDDDESDENSSVIFRSLNSSDDVAETGEESSNSMPTGDHHSSISSDSSDGGEQLFTDQEMEVVRTIEAELTGNQVVLMWPDRTVYIGHVKDLDLLKPHGTGVMIWSSKAGRKHVYSGEFSCGKLSGIGTMVWSTGKEVSGNWHDNTMHGKCTVTWPNGCQYKGDMEDSLPAGRGVYTWPGGVKLSCSTWVAGQPSGLASFLYPDGCRYQGFFLNGEQHGRWVCSRRDWKENVHCHWDRGEPVGHASTLRKPTLRSTRLAMRPVKKLLK